MWVSMVSSKIFVSSATCKCYLSVLCLTETILYDIVFDAASYVLPNPERVLLNQITAMVELAMFLRLWWPAKNGISVSCDDALLCTFLWKYVLLNVLYPTTWQVA